jgi:hypothetical protein
VQDPQDNWSPVETIPNSALGPYIGYDATVDSQGVVHVVWRNTTGRSNSNTAYYSQRSTTGTWTEILELPGLGKSNYVTQVAMAPDQTLHIASAAIYLNRSPEGIWSEPSYPFGTSPLGANIAVDNLGGIHAVVGDGGEIFYAELISDTTWTTPINVSTNSTLSYAPQIRVDIQGRIHFWWINVTGPNRNGLLYRSLFNDVLTDTIPLTDVPENSNLGFVTVAPNGVVHLVISGDYTNRNVSGIWSTPVHQNADRSSLTVAPNNDVHWFWECADYLSCQWSDLIHSRLQASGEWSSTTNLGRRDSLPSVSFGLDGEVVAVWPRWIEQEDDVDIFFSDYAPKNVPTSTPTPTVTATPMQTATPTPTETLMAHMYLPAVQN